MRLTTPSPTCAALAANIGDVLDRRLSPNAAAPLAVAFSGGGDSLALLLAVLDWARPRGRPVVALHVDHALQASSRAWARACAAAAARLGCGFELLDWTGDKPSQGLPAAARAARHALLADAARAAGARVVLMGHTADDLREARMMREAGGSVGAPGEWSPSPAWPQGRGVFLLRPMLALDRSAIRAWLSARGEAWIDDPANDDPAYARVRARRALAGASTPLPVRNNTADASKLARLAQVSDAGEIIIGRDALREAGAEVRAFVAAACVCAGGGTRPPQSRRIARLADALTGQGPVRATLAGARVAADERAASFSREAGEIRRGGLAPLALPTGETVVWDGRYELLASAGGRVARGLAGVARRLPSAERRALLGRPAHLRGALPAIEDDEGRVSSPLLAPAPAVRASCLVATRLTSALGLVSREDDL